MAMAEIQRTITRRLSRLPSRFPTLDLDDAQQVQHSVMCVPDKASLWPDTAGFATAVACHRRAS